MKKLYAIYDNDKATLTLLSRRSPELDRENIYGFMTEPGEQRGNPKNKDSYFMVIIKLFFVFGASHYDYNCFK